MAFSINGPYPLMELFVDIYLISALIFQKHISNILY